MAASDHLGLQFEHHRAKDLSHELSAIHPVHGEVGFLKWYGHSGGPDAQPGEISMVQTYPGHRRQGVATALWNHAQQYDPAPIHGSVQTDLGSKWSRSVGGPRA